MSRSTRLVALVAAALIAGPAASAEAASSFSGTAINCLHGGPIPYAPVELDGPAPRSGRADAAGHFTFYNLPDGAYFRVRATATNISWGAMFGMTGWTWLNRSAGNATIIVRPTNNGACVPHLR